MQAWGDVVVVVMVVVVGGGSTGHCSSKLS